MWKQGEVYQSVSTAKRINWMRTQLSSDCSFGNVKGIYISKPHVHLHSHKLQVNLKV